MNFDPVAEIYDETRDRPTEAELSFLFDELKRAETVLDLGTGTGRLALPLQKRGREVVGVDISRKMLAHARRRGVENLVRSNVLLLPFADKSFDSSIVVHLLHLIREWKPLIREIARVTRNTLVSLDSKRPSGRVSMRLAYLDKVKQRGVFPLARIEGEIALTDLVKPFRMLLIDTPKFRKKSDEILEELEKRWLAISWGVPNHVHSEVVRELRKEFSGGTMEYDYETYLLVWKADDLESMSS